MANQIVCGYFLVIAGATLLSVSVRLEVVSPLIQVFVLLALLLFSLCAGKARMSVGGKKG